jgi:LytS/YehU family sensor histidine kinase
VEAKTIAFILTMGALGNLLFATSSYAVPIAFGVSLDLSLIAVFIAGYYGGPFTGFVSGLLVGLFPGVVFGPLGMSSWLGLFGLPLGKGLTGLTAGIISKALKLGQRPHSSILAVPSTLSAYVPECIFTYAFFAFFMPFFLGISGTNVFLAFILPKAIGEVIIMSFLMAALIGNHGFNDFITRYFTKPMRIPNSSRRQDRLEA